MCACQVGCTDNGSQVMGILDIVQKNQEGILPLLPGSRQHFVHRTVIVGRSLGNDALVMAGGGHLIQALFCHKIDDGIVLSCFSLNGVDASVLTAVLNKQLIDGLTGSKGLQYRISSLYGQFFVIHTFNPLLIPFLPVPGSALCGPSDTDSPSAPRSLWPGGNSTW